MDIGLREWLIVIGIIVIAGILFDGWRRMSGGKGKLKFRLDPGGHPYADEDEPEEPGLVGSVRIKSTPAEAEQAAPATVSQKEASRKRQEPEQGDLRLEEPVPTLLTPVLDEASKPDSASAKPVDEVLVINVIARDPEGFKGPALLQNILESGLRFGEMDIFHRHESMAGNGEVLFSMANGVKPGTFDLDDIDLFSTRAVSFFLGLPGPRHPKQAFDLMVAAARKLSSELNGELKDEQRSVMTAQTIEHYRQRIADHERRKLTQKR